jgi:hypothetical protein
MPPFNWTETEDVKFVSPGVAEVYRFEHGSGQAAKLLWCGTYHGWGEPRYLKLPFPTAETAMTVLERAALEGQSSSLWQEVDGVYHFLYHTDGCADGLWFRSGGKTHAMVPMNRRPFVPCTPPGYGQALPADAMLATKAAERQIVTFLKDAGPVVSDILAILATRRAARTLTKADLVSCVPVFRVFILAVEAADRLGLPWRECLPHPLPEIMERSEAKMVMRRKRMPGPEPWISVVPGTTGPDYVLDLASLKITDRAGVERSHGR